MQYSRKRPLAALITLRPTKPDAPVRTNPGNAGSMVSLPGAATARRLVPCDDDPPMMRSRSAGFCQGAASGAFARRTATADVDVFFPAMV